MNKKQCHMIPQEEKQCVWMTSGLISYKLCTRDYHCEDCVFDQVIRDEAAVAAGRRQAGPAVALPNDASLSGLQPALFYDRHHCWVKVEDPDRVVIGIDGILARLVSPVVAVVLPREGEPVVRGECFGHIIQQRHIVELIAPLNGTVLKVNQDLRQTPCLVADDPWEGGWLVSVAPENLEHDLRSLMFGRKAQQWYHRTQQEAEQASAEVFRSHGAELGATLQDGGETVGGFTAMLSPEHYDRIIETLSRGEEHT